jgi:hypothetical protein
VAAVGQASGNVNLTLGGRPQRRRRRQRAESVLG